MIYRFFNKRENNFFIIQIIYIFFLLNWINLNIILYDKRNTLSFLIKSYYSINFFSKSIQKE